MDMHTTTGPKVLLVDDHRLARLGLRAALEAADIEGLQVLEASTLEQALAQLAQLTQGDRGIDVVVLDLNLPDSRGLASLVTLRQAHPLVRVVVMSGVSDEVIRDEALALGAVKFCFKGSESGGIDDLLQVIGHAPSAGQRAALQSPGAHQKAMVHRSGMQLTPRELQTLDLVLQGLSNQEIADRTELKLGTIKNLISGLFVVFGVSSRSKLINALR
jgi:DNA-binding NarL/FixJ family response regulator